MSGLPDLQVSICGPFEQTLKRLFRPRIATLREVAIGIQPGAPGREIMPVISWGYLVVTQRSPESR